MPNVHHEGFPSLEWLKSLAETDYEKSFVSDEYGPGMDYYLARLDRLGLAGDRVLDAGCGVGQWSLALARRFDQVDAVDINRKRLNLATRAAMASKVKNVSFIESSIEDLSLADATFDAIFCYGVVMFTDTPRSLAMFYRLLKPGGNAYLCLNGDGWNYHLIRERGKDNAAVRAMGQEVLYTTYWHRALGQALGQKLSGVRESPGEITDAIVMQSLQSIPEGRDLVEMVRRYCGLDFERRLIEGAASMIRGQAAVPSLSITRAFLPDEMECLTRKIGFVNFKWAVENHLAVNKRSPAVPDRYFGVYDGALAVWECLVSKAETAIRANGSLKVRVCDPGSHLPPAISALLPQGANGTLWAPDRGVRVHTTSVQRLISRTHRRVVLSFTPDIPVTSELGLTRYRPILYWLPDGKELSFPLDNTSSPTDEDRFIRALEDKHAGMERIAETSLSEQIHYFADNFGIICPKPIQVSAVVSNQCNLKCVMCPYHSPEIKPTHTTSFIKAPKQMPIEVMKRIALECGSLKIPVKMGNIEEPLLHPFIVEFVSLCRSNGVPGVHITTNGIPLNRDRAERLLDAGLTSLYISLDAARPDTYRRVRGSALHRAEANVRRFLRLRREKHISCTVMVSLVKNRQVSEVEISEFCARWLGEADGVILYTLGEYESGSTRFDHLHEVARRRMRVADHRWPCLNPWQEVYILPDGQVDYCCETVSRRAFGNLVSMGDYPSTSLQEIWLGEPFTSLRKALIMGELAEWPACRDCGIWMAHVSESTVENGRRVTRNMITEIIR